jgi:hypothetical protein
MSINDIIVGVRRALQDNALLAYFNYATQSVQAVNLSNAVKFLSIGNSHIRAMGEQILSNQEQILANQAKILAHHGIED